MRGKFEQDKKLVKKVHSGNYNPQTGNSRYSDNNTGYPKHHAKNSFGSGLMLVGELLQRFKKNHPNISKALYNYSPTFLFLLAVLTFIASAVVVGLFFYSFGLPAIIIASSLIAASALFLISAGIASVIRWLTNDVFGSPLDNHSDSIYKNAPQKLTKLMEHNDTLHPVKKLSTQNPNEISCKYRTATATLSVPGGNKLPKLILSADNHEDAGYLEGYMQGEQIFRTLKQMDKVFGKIESVVQVKQFFGLAKSDQDVNDYIDEMCKNNMPVYMVNEMKAKVDGYNRWVKDNKLPKEEEIDFYKYFKLQLLPDIHNFNIYAKPDQTAPLAGAEVVSTGCTSIAYQVGNYTCYIRILDWASHDIAGKACIEIERNIQDYPKTQDVAISILSGGVSMVTTNNLGQQMLTQINVAPVDEDKKNPKGMPGAFAIRYMAEHCNSVDEMKTKMLAGNDTHFNTGPLSGMHISATDGKDTLSFHAYQGGNKATHLLEIMKQKNGDASRPMVVANFGHKDGKPYDFHDSTRRLENVNRFFSDNPVDSLNLELNKHEDNIQKLQKHMAGIMQLDLVNNFESVFAGMYIFYDGKIIAAKAAIDNNYAGSRPLDKMMELSVVDEDSISSLSIDINLEL